MKNKNLDNFVGKICTVFTVPINRDFKEENPTTYPQPVFHYFIGKVLEIDDKGIVLQQWNSNKKLKSYFFINYVVGICEEEVLDPSRPEDSKIIEDYKKINETATKNAEVQHEILKENQQKIRENPDLDIESLMNVSKKINKDV